jgi:peptidylprolyl isomerase
MKKFWLILALIIIAALAYIFLKTPMQRETFIMKTNMGDITIELFNDDRPLTAGNFSKLSKEGFYDGVKFHRVIEGFMIQGGDPISKDDTQRDYWGTGGPGYKIKDELEAPNENLRGTISMANAGPNTGGSQFFINLVDNTPLDSRHSVFGKVVAGMDVVDAIGAVEVEAMENHKPLRNVVIESVTQVVEE